MSNDDRRDREVREYVGNRMAADMPPEFTRTVMDDVGRTTQRRRGFAWPIFTGLATVAAALAVVVIGLGLIDQPDDVGSEPTPSASASPMATPSAISSPTDTPEPSPAVSVGDEPREVTVAELWQANQSIASVAEYGDTELVLDAYLWPLGAVDPCPPLEPRWFTSCDSATALFLRPPESPPGDDPGLQPPVVVAVFHPDLGGLPDWGETNPSTGEQTVVRVIAHYDDPAASDCRYPEWYEGIGPSPSPSDVVEQCRSTLVITAIEPMEP